MKTELLVQMDGLRSRGAEEQVFVMTASNMPWDLDVAVLRRYYNYCYSSVISTDWRSEC